MNAEITNDQAEELAGMANKPRPIAYAKPFIVLRRGLIMQHIAICNHEGHGYTIPIYTEAPQTALSQPEAVEGWKPMDTAPKDGTEFVVRYTLQGNVKKLVCWNNIHGFWQSKGESVNMAGCEWSPILSDAAPNPPVQQSVREAFEERFKATSGLLDAEHYLLRDANDQYIESMTAGYWEWWQAALSTSPLIDKNDQTEVAVARVDMSDSANTAPRKELIFINGSLATLPVGSLLYARHQPDSNELVEALQEHENLLVGAAYAAAAKVVDGWAKTASEYGFDGDMEQFMRVKADIEALTPAAAMDEIEQFGMRIVRASTDWNKAYILSDEQVRAIVANVRTRAK
jgi:hypothetical protein